MLISNSATLNRNEYALIVAGGKGTRIKSEIPKQFLEICGKPILIHTIEAFIRYSRSIRIVLVLPKEDFQLWYGISDRHKLKKEITLQAGGETRFESVKNGLDKVSGPGLVAIHDGVRPLVSEDIISDSFRIAAVTQSAVASMPLKESIRKLIGEESRHIDRAKFRMIQTPQTFDIDLIKKCYQISFDPTLTDDASVVERAGHKITLFDGSYDNIKITTPEDLTIAQALMNARAAL